MRINHGSSNEGKMFNIFKLKVMPSHFMDPPQNLWKDFRDMVFKNRIKPFASDSSVQDNQISFSSSINCLFSPSW
jgi:hypothetical protein